MDIHDQLYAAMANRETPEGVSVLVALTPNEVALWGDKVTSVLTNVAQELARQQYPDRVQTGVVLYVGMDELGPGRHEVVLEVQP